MKLEHAKLIVAVAEGFGYDIRLYENYSGRGMFGKTTSGVVGALPEIVSCIAAVGVDLGSLLNAQGKSEGIFPEDFVTDMNISLDDMGRNEVIVY